MIKKNKKKLLIGITICTVIAGCAVYNQQKNTKTTSNNTQNTQYQYLNYLPTSDNTIYHHTYYSLAYNEKHEQPDWVYYLLTKEFINGTAKRKNNFKSDPIISTESASLNDYKKSGYDRGHLCPAAAMKLNQTAMDETFYLSNMSPQIPGFNRGEWKKLEAQVREWTIEEDSILVITGPIFKNNIKSIGKNSVTVPGYYYKVLYDLTKPQKMTAFILPHLSKPKSFMQFQTTVNQVEQETGIDFFSILNDEIEEKLEANQNW